MRSHGGLSGVNRPLGGVAAAVIAGLFASAALAQTPVYTWTGGSFSGDNFYDPGNWAKNGDPFAFEAPNLNANNVVTIDVTQAGVQQTTVTGLGSIRDGQRINLTLSAGTLDTVTNDFLRIGYEQSAPISFTIGGGSAPATMNRFTNLTGQGTTAPLFGYGIRSGVATTFSVLSGGTLNFRASTTSQTGWSQFQVAPIASNNPNGNGTLTLGGGRLDLGGRDLILGYNGTFQKGFFNFTAGELANVRSFMANSNVPGGVSPAWSTTDYTVATTLLQQGGTIKPGTVTYPGNDYTQAVFDDVGAMTVYGNYTQQANATLAIDIASSSSYDVFNVVQATGTLGGGTTGGGVATLAGTLQLNLLGGFTPAPGEAFSVLTAATSLDASGLRLSDPAWSFQVVGNTLQLVNAPPPQEPTWTGAVDTLWGDAGNWTASQRVVPPDAAGAVAIFGSTGAGATVDLAATSRTVGTVDFRAAVPTTIQSTGGSLVLDNSGSAAVVTAAAGASHQITAPVQLSAAGASVSVAGAADVLSLAGGLTGSGGLTKTGAGTLAIAGSGSGFTGPTAATAGAIRLDAATALAQSTVTVGVANGLRFGTSAATVGGLAGSGGTTLENGGSPVTLSVGTNNASTSYSGVLSGSGGLTKVGTGTLTLQSRSTYAGETVVDGGTLVLAPPAPSVQPAGVAAGSQYRLMFVSDGRTLVRANAGGGTGPTSIADFNSFATAQANLNPDLAALGTTWNAVVSTRGPGATSAVTNTGTSGPGGQPIYNMGGQLIAADNQTLWSTTAGQVLANPVRYTQFGVQSTAPRVVTGMTQGGGISGDWSLIYPTGGYTLAGDYLSTQVIAGNGGSATLGSGNWSTQFNPGDPNAYSYEPNAIYVMSGAITAVATADALPTTTVLRVGTGGTVDLAGTSQQVAALADSSGGGTVTNSSTTSASTLTLSPGGSTAATFSGVIAGGGGAGTIDLVKSGSGTQVLAGTNTFTGSTSVAAGTLVVNGSLNATSGVAVLSGGTLAGGGSVAAASIATGATIAPGDGIGTLTTTGGVTWASGGNLNWQLADATAAAGTGFDLLSVGSGLAITATSADPFEINLWTLSGTNPVVSGDAANFSATQGYTWKLASAAGGITGFAADAFVINTAATNGAAGFSNGLSGGSFSLAVAGNDLNLVFTPGGPPTIVIDVASGSQTQAQAGYPAIASAVSVTKTGAGTLVFDAANAYAGPTTVSAGTLEVANGDGVAGSAVTVSAGATLAAATGTTIKAPSVTLNGGTLSAGTLAVNAASGITTLTINAGTVAAGAAVVVGPGGLVDLPDSSRVVIGATSLAVDELSGGGKVDLGSGEIAVAAGGILAANLVADIVAGRNGGAWNGTTGITSAAAAASGGTRDVGYVIAGDGSARVSFAAAGDTNLDGLVDLVDLLEILSSGTYGTGTPSVWYQGDFNYDGITDLLDLLAILGSGTYDQGNYFPAAPVTPSSLAVVPEPGSLAILATAAGGLLALRLARRR